MSIKLAEENADLGTITNDIDLLKKDIARLMEKMKNDATQTVSAEAQRLYGVASAEGERTVAAIAQHVEERPIASLLIAFAAGYLTSRIIAR
jgi:hypothetical protein